MPAGVLFYLLLFNLFCCLNKGGKAESVELYRLTPLRIHCYHVGNKAY